MQTVLALIFIHFNLSYFPHANCPSISSVQFILFSPYKLAWHFLSSIYSVFPLQTGLAFVQFNLSYFPHTNWPSINFLQFNLSYFPHTNWPSIIFLCSIYPIVPMQTGLAFLQFNLSYFASYKLAQFFCSPIYPIFPNARCQAQPLTRTSRFRRAVGTHGPPRVKDERFTARSHSTN